MWSSYTATCLSQGPSHLGRSGVATLLLPDGSTDHVLQHESAVHTSRTSYVVQFVLPCDVRLGRLRTLALALRDLLHLGAQNLGIRKLSGQSFEDAVMRSCHVNRLHLRFLGHKHPPA